MKGFASILSSPKVSVGDLFLLKKENDRFPSPVGRQTLGNDGNNHCGNNTRTRITTLRDDDNNKGTIKAGFTLIELLVVVLIIGILASVALPQYNLAVEKSKVAEAMSVIKSIAQAREVYRLVNGNLPFDFGELDIDIPGEDDDGECVITKNWRYCIDVGTTDAGRYNVSDENYYVISYYPQSENDSASGHFTCYAYGEFPHKICRALGGKQRGGFYNSDEYILP
ncbi:type IV pilin protein [Candidatus Avelusimicrobium fimicolum]|uniref:type IV pilin protein n=1 Tax=Candidatus Avelusimicrobium fimicolum TaxID=3416216 RepID=UPI003D148A32